MTPIYKIFRAGEFAVLQEQGETDGAPIDVQDGYVHMSTPEQVEETAAKHFAGESDLVLLLIDADSFGSELVWEPSRGGALFPHLYRPLRTSDVIWSRDLPLVDGTHNFTGLLDR